MQMHMEKRMRVNLLLIREAFLFLCKGRSWVGGQRVKNEMHSLGTFVIFPRSCCKNAVPETKGRGGSKRGMLGWVTVQYNFGHLGSSRESSPGLLTLALPGSAR